MTKFIKIIVLFLVITSIVIISKGQDLPRLEKGKMLFIIGTTQHCWDNKQLHDSINWSDVYSVTILKDSVAIQKYGDLGKNGACIIVLKDKLKLNIKQIK